MKDNLFNKEETMVSIEFANLAFGIVYNLLLSSVLESTNYEKPQVGDWCVEISSLFRKDIGSLGIVLEVRKDGYLIETVFGQKVNWSNCKMRKVPSNLVDKGDIESIRKLIKESGME